MNTFAGNFTLKEKNKDITSQDFDMIPAGNGTYFCMGQIDVATTTELVSYLEGVFGTFEFHDLSLTGEDEVEIWAQDYFEDGVYECVSFEGPAVDIEMIAERFESVEEVCVIREAEKSQRYNNRIIKVDFLY